MELLLSERVQEAIDAAAENGYSVADIAKACGIKPQAVYQWMDGTTKSIDGDNLAELCELSGYRAIWITKERGQKSDTRAVQQARELMQTMTPARQADAVKIIAALAEQETDDKKAG
jgi:transposase-like protein